MSSPLIKALMQAAVYDHPVGKIQLIETHISWVLLTGEFAYKIKKPVNLGFLDFSGLDKREKYCREELRLNRRLAPSVYLEVVAITGSAEAPVLGGKGPAIEYAVKMVQFPQQAQFDRLLASGDLAPVQMDELAQLVADFHIGAAAAARDSHMGTPLTVCAPVEENFHQIHAVSQADERLERLEHWSAAACEHLGDCFAQRHADGFVRECHGDMHLRNIAWVDNQPLVFDCIEFSPALRWIDVISEVAFLVMDLMDHKRSDLAWRYLNKYLQYTGDYSGTAVLPFYLVYRAMVRAKVEAIRASQTNISEQERSAALAGYDAYLELAYSFTRESRPILIVTRGMSASGKSTVTQALLEQLGAIRIRSDVERKRLFGIDATQSANDAVGSGIYNTEASEQTYQQLASLARAVLQSGQKVIVDAAFLAVEQVDAFKAVAQDVGADFVVLEITAPADVLRQRIRQRNKGVSDADLPVLEHQLSAWRPLPEVYSDDVITVDTSVDLAVEELVREVHRRCGQDRR